MGVNEARRKMRSIKMGPAKRKTIEDGKPNVHVYGVLELRERRHTSLGSNDWSPVTLKRPRGRTYMDEPFIRHVPTYVYKKFTYTQIHGFPEYIAGCRKYMCVRSEGYMAVT